MPCVLKAPLAIASSDVSRSVASVARSPARPGNGTIAGVVETRSESTSYAAVATAASTDAFAPTRFSSRYGSMLLRADRVDGVVHGALDHAHVDLECRRRTPVRPRERDERVRRDLVPVIHLTGVGPRWWCGRDAEDAEPGQQRTDCHRDERDGSSTQHRFPPHGPCLVARCRRSVSGWVASWRPPPLPRTVWRDRRGSGPYLNGVRTDPNGSHFGRRRSGAYLYGIRCAGNVQYFATRPSRQRLGARLAGRPGSTEPRGRPGPDHRRRS